jgi:hypothetical protein
MDTLRGNFADSVGIFEDEDRFDSADDDTVSDSLPAAIGQDERRMQVRAYNFWTGLLGDRKFPSIDDLDANSLPDFGPYSVLLDFTAGLEDPGVTFLGRALAEECGAGDEITRLSDIPSRSLLSRITDHYMQILANQAPIGFEAEFVNQRELTFLYRGILLPFSSDDETIDFIYGVINWKEMADQQTTDELLLQIDQALAEIPEIAPRRPSSTPITDWADGPAAELSLPGRGSRDLTEHSAQHRQVPTEDIDLPRPHFGFENAPRSADEITGTSGNEGVKPAIDLDFDDDDLGLSDLLALARDLAETARTSEDRSRSALYDAIGRAYDFALVAEGQPEEFGELVEASGLTIQDRAPMTPIVKLVFGVNYDKTRLTEYAAALSHARRLGLGRGSLGDFLRNAEGGLKGVVQTERQLRRQEAGRPAARADAPRKALADKLRKIEPIGFDAIAPDGEEFGLVMIRRLPGGDIAMLGEVSGDPSLVDRAARKLLG